MENLSFEEWAKLFQITEKFKEASPWQWIASEDVFAVVNPQDGEIEYYSILRNGKDEFGSGDKTRDYTHVSDVVAANLLAMEHGNKTIYNIGAGAETSDREMFDTLAGILGYSGDPRYASVRTGEICHICLNATRAQKEIGWQVQISLKEGLLQTVSYYGARFGQINP